MGNPVVFLTRTRSVLALVQPVGQTSTVDTAGTQLSHVLSSKSLPVGEHSKAVLPIGEFWPTAIRCPFPLLEAVF